MNSKRILSLLAVLAILPLASCSGLKSKGGGGGGGGGGTGSASLSLTISDTPPANSSVLSFTLPVIGITLTPSSGSPVQVFSSGNFELTHLQSETDLVAADLSVAAGTYTAVKVTVSAPSGVLINASNSALGTCPAGAVCNITGSAATITYTFGSPLVLTANSKQWLNLDFNYNNAVVTTNNVVAIDVTQTAVLTASTSVPTGIPSGNFANIDDFTGQVTAVSSSSITVKSLTRGSLTASITSSTVYFDPQSQCTGGAGLSCIQAGSVVSVQGLLSNAGVVTATSLDIIDASKTPTDEVEGIIYPSPCNGGSNYGLILGDGVINTTGSPLTTAGFGQGICLSLSQTATFAIDDGILTSQAGVPTSVGFSTSSDIFQGQTVRAKITGAAKGTNGVINANATALILRFSRLTGTVGTVSGNAFTITGLPAYLGTFNNVAPQVETYANATLFEGVANIGSLTSGQTVSFSALYPNPGLVLFQFHAAKVRTP